MRSEGIPWSVTLRDQGPIELLNCDPARREQSALVGCAERQDGGALLVQPNRHAARVGVLRQALEREQAAATYYARLHLCVALPAVQATVRIEDLAEQSIHEKNPLSQARLGGDDLSAVQMWGA